VEKIIVKKNKMLVENGFNIGDNVDFTKVLTNNRKTQFEKRRKVERPPYEQLIKNVNEIGYKGTGRKYGVSDNSIRKWLKTFEKYGI